MKREPVHSTYFRSVGYNFDMQVLEIEFYSGSIYLYFNVPEHIHQGLMSAYSKDRFHHDYIKDRYHFTRVRQFSTVNKTRGPTGAT